MSLKLYFQYEKGELTPLPGQMDAEYDYEEIKWSLPPLITPSQEVCNLLLHIDWDNKEIIAVEKELEPEFFASQSKLNEIKKSNSDFLKKLKKNIRINTIQKPDDLYISDIKWELLCETVSLKKYPLVIGPKGCGKTIAFRSLAHATERQFYPINCGAIFKPKQTLIGTTMAHDGSTYIVDSEYMKYFTSDKPTLIFLDEISRIPAGAANYFMTMTDREQNYIYVEEKGERVYKGKDVVFCAAGNFGYEYADTRNIDGAFLDRWIKFVIDYLPEDEEVELISKRAPKASEGEIRVLVKSANECRQNTNLRVAVSTRQLIDMAHYFEKGFTLTEVVDEIFVNLFYNGSMDERQNVKMLFNGKI